MACESARSVESPFAIRHSPLEHWLLWQLSDSAFPTGGFAHSAGLEAAWQHGEVKNRGELASFVEAGLHQLGRAVLPFVIGSHTETQRLEEFDRLCDAFTTNHVANRVSRAQGKAFLTAVQRIFLSGKTPPSSSLPNAPFNHFACVFGGALSLLDVSQETTARLFFFNHLRGVLAAAVRLNIVGPMEAQTMQHQFSATAEDVLKASASLTLDDIAQTSPLLDLWQGAQDRLYSRLFQS
ncbi:MAG TPA: urease accessory UreF family protein [Verrucomicrobiae bacterium]|nr:urease accessory UreF family protein [Verrucomicrobiae bacterium]